MTSRVAVIKEDMRQMGELILMMAADVASAQEISAQTVIREGDVTEQIMALCSELDADYVVVGKPMVREGTSVFDDEKIQALNINLKRSCRAELVVAD
jgi:RNase H-fold protein (predicted Holliday junction resolvase)